MVPVLLTIKRSFEAVGSKLVPVKFTTEPVEATRAETLAIEGGAAEAFTVND
jgi:hypothetical protein